MQAQKEAPPDMQCRDKFLLQSVKVNDGLTANDITAEMFNKEAGNVVEECKLKVVYISPPSTAQEGSEEGPSPGVSFSDGKHANAAEFASGARAFTEGLEAQEISSEEKALMTKLTEEKNKAIQQSTKLRHELDLFKREGSKSSGGVSFMFVMLIGLLGIIMGYIMKKW
ncbi:hypothetical protein Gotri_008635 [Gossypium trilobum]|uniref:MSP domain-containing protein n=1 Tax=Gossypium trilobum TaxID=34281 RepID=A0A7J9EJZ9_9ROSI|nr:hypothetical protein [Gossypium trilobum]